MRGYLGNSSGTSFNHIDYMTSNHLKENTDAFNFYRKYILENVLIWSQQLKERMSELCILSREIHFFLWYWLLRNHWGIWKLVVDEQTREASSAIDIYVKGEILSNKGIHITTEYCVSILLTCLLEWLLPNISKSHVKYTKL